MRSASRLNRREQNARHREILPTIAPIAAFDYDYSADVLSQSAISHQREIARDGSCGRLAAAREYPSSRYDATDFFQESQPGDIGRALRVESSQSRG